MLTWSRKDINLEDYNKGVMSTCTYEGKMYCIGTYTGAVLMYYNKDLFDAAGVPYPSSTEPMTIDEYAAMIKSSPSHPMTFNSASGAAMPGRPTGGSNGRPCYPRMGRTIEGYINDDATAHFYDVLAQLPKDGSVMTVFRGPADGRYRPAGAGQIGYLDH